MRKDSHTMSRYSYIYFEILLVIYTNIITIQTICRILMQYIYNTMLKLTIGENALSITNANITTLMCS